MFIEYFTSLVVCLASLESTLFLCLFADLRSDAWKDAFMALLRMSMESYEPEEIIGKGKKRHRKELSLDSGEIRRRLCFCWSRHPPPKARRPPSAQMRDCNFYLLETN